MIRRVILMAESFVLLAACKAGDLRGFERWALDDDALILESLAHPDDAE